MQRLHRGHDALGGEARQQMVGQHFGVLDPVPDAGGVAVGVEREANRAVADRVRGQLEAGAREAQHRRAQPLRVGPETVLSAAARVRRFQPGRAALDDAVGEELRHARAPQLPALVAQRDPRRQFLLAGVGLDPERHDQPQRQLAGGLELAQQRERLRLAVHRVPAREALGVELPQRVHQRAPALGRARLREPVIDVAVRAQLAQLACRDAVAHDDRRVIGKLDRPVDARDGQHRRRREVRVEVEEGHQRRAAGVLLERAPVEFVPAVDRIVEPEAALEPVGAAQRVA